MRDANPGPTRRTCGGGSRAGARGLAAVGALVLANPVARAADAPITAPAPADSAAIPAAQIASAVALQLAGLTGAVLLVDQVEGKTGLALGLATVALTPALEGLVVCGIGRLSRHYTGHCGPPVVAAWAGAALGTGIYFGAHEVLGGNDTLGALAFLGLPALAATVVWHERKTRRTEEGAPPPAAPAAPRPAAIADPPPTGPWTFAPTAAGTVVLPLFATRF